MLCQPCNTKDIRVKHDITCFICQEDLTYGKHTVYSAIHLTELGNFPKSCSSCRVCNNCLYFVRNENNMRLPCGIREASKWHPEKIYLDKMNKERSKCPDCNAICIDVQKHQETKCKKATRFCDGCRTNVTCENRNDHKRCFINCDYCRKEFFIDLTNTSKHFDDLLDHYKFCSSLDTAYCITCNTSFRNESMLEEHKKLSFLCSLRKCDDCDITFNDFKDLHNHHSETICQLCNKNGDGCSITHKKSGKCTYDCKKCLLKNIQTSEKQIHDEDVCTRNFTYTCEVCGRNDILWKSRTTHSLKCNKNFPSIRQLSSNISTNNWTNLFRSNINSYEDYKSVIN